MTRAIAPALHEKPGLHPLRQSLRNSQLARWIKARPVLRGFTLIVWSIFGRLYHLMMALLRAPLTVLLAPFLACLYLTTLLPPRKVVRNRSRHPASRQIVMLVISEVFRDPRVEREARALAGAGFPVKILYPDYFSFHHDVGEIDWGPGITFAPLPRWIATYVHNFPYVFSIHYLWAAIKERPFAFHAHDLSTAMVGMAAARFARVHCVCDFHEWYSENVSWDSYSERYVPHPPHVRFVYSRVERLAMRQASAVITVCDSIARELERIGGGRRRVEVIRNIPSLTRPSPLRCQPLRQELGLGPDRFILLYQGGTGPTRLLEPVIEAIALVPAAVLVIRGPGIEHYGPGYHELAARLNILDRVFCLPPVPSDQVVDAAAGADAGVWTLPNLSKNFYFALPNKLFEYMAAGLPILGAHFPEARRLIEGLDIGHCFDPYDPESIAAALRRLVDDPNRVSQIRQRMPSALASIDASTEWTKLVDIYRALEADPDALRGSSAGPPTHVE